MGSTASGPRTRPGAPQATARPTIAAVGADDARGARRRRGQQVGVEHRAVAAREHVAAGGEPGGEVVGAHHGDVLDLAQAASVVLEHGREHLTAAAVDERHEPAAGRLRRVRKRERDGRERGHAGEAGACRPPARAPARWRCRCAGR